MKIRGPSAKIKHKLSICQVDCWYIVFFLKRYEPLLGPTDSWRKQTFSREVAGQIHEAQNQSSQGLSLLLGSISGCREFRKNCKCNGRNVNGRGLHNLLDLYFFLFKKKNQVIQDRDHIEYQRGSPTPEKDGAFTHALVQNSIQAIIHYEVIQNIWSMSIIKSERLLKRMFLKFIHKSITLIHLLFSFLTSSYFLIFIYVFHS